MHVKVAGSGPDLVLLHGWGMHAGVWDGIAALLALQFRVLSVELPGRASPACAPYTLDAVAAALADICAPRATVCGWSLGGQIALRWAFMHPEQVERLVLIASTPRFVRGPDWNSGMEAAVFDAFAQDLAHDANGALQRFAILQAHGDADARNVSRRLRACLSARDTAALAAGLQILKDTDLRADLPRIAQPALIVHGERDTVVPLAAGEYLERTLPQATLAVIAGAAHAPFVTQPQNVARRITEFCRG
ncbi:MAG: pimeloyl-ACP methyl ester esterase BioH [Betaproteobacteria bacterium]|nr:pimeloyl-ACP methyl ester esterase BioH [Betaproteobacteria bacterium]